MPTGLLCHSLLWISATADLHTGASQGLSMTGTVWTPRISPRRQSVYCSPAKKDLLSHSGVAVKPYFSAEKWCNDKFWKDNGQTSSLRHRGEREPVQNPLSMVCLTTLQQYHQSHMMHMSSMLGTLGCSVTELVIYCSGLLFLPLLQEERWML